MSNVDTRRIVVATALAAMFGFVAAPRALHAQSKFPEKPVHVIVPYGAGGVADVTTRLVVDKAGQTLGQSFIVENRPGAGMIVGAKAALAAPPDGYTLFLAGNGSAISKSLFKSLPFRILSDFAPVAALAEFEMVLATKGRCQARHDPKRRDLR